MIGALDQLVTLQARTVTPDGIGGTLVTWADLTENPAVWAKVTVKRGTENVEDGRRNARQTATFEIYNRADISELNRIIWNGEAWNIINVMRSSGRRMTIVIEAERGTAA